MNFDFPFVDALYRDESIARYAGNPYIEALPSLPDDLTLARTLTHLPAFDPAERSLSGPERMQRLDALQSVFVALPRLVRLARAMLKMIRTGYGARKPYSKDDNQTLQEMYAMQQAGGFHSLRQTALAAQHSMALIGASGCGKSSGLRHIAGMLPPALYHEKWGKWQLPFVFIEMSYDGESVHTLASELFQELDRLLPDAGYTQLYMERARMNAQQRLAKALAIAYEHGVGMIVVDEHQNQRSVGNEPTQRQRKNAATNTPKSETPLTKLLITASNVSHIPLMMAGTLEMQSMLGARFTRARRMAGRGSAVWTPLERSGNVSKPGEFELLLRALWRYQWVRQPVELTEAWSALFFEHTQGIPDIMVKLFESVQEAAIAGGAETMTPELVQAVFASEFVTTSFGITALRENDRTLLEAVTDLYQPERIEQSRKGTHQFLPPRIVSKSLDPASRTPAVKRPAKIPRPSPQAVSVEVHADSDLRTTLLAGADRAETGVVDLMQHKFPT